MARDDYMKFKFHCPYRKSDWSTALLIGVGRAASALQRQVQQWWPESLRHPLSGP